MTERGTLRFVVPEGLDDPERVSGGNVYDRRLADGLSELGWQVELATVSGPGDVAAALRSRSSETAVLADGLVAALDPSALEHASSERSRVVVLAHMVSEAFAEPDRLRVAGERRALRAADAVIATSRWTAGELVARGIIDADRIAVAVPGATSGPRSIGEPGAFVCVGVLAPHKGQDVLLEALASLAGLDWTCTIAGSRAADADFARRVAAEASAFGPRVRVPGVLRVAQLDSVYQNAGLLVVPSRTEAFGMVIGDARRRGLPVIASRTGGIPEAVAGGGSLMVDPGDAGALADALRAWLTDGKLRDRLRGELARVEVPTWDDTVARVHEVLVAA